MAKLIWKSIFGVLFVLSLCLGCKQKGAVSTHPFQHLDNTSFEEFKKPKCAYRTRQIRYFIDSLRLATRDTNYIDLLCNRYYADGGNYLWIQRDGLSLNADTLLDWLTKISRTGLPEALVFLPQIRENYHRLQQLNFDQAHSASKTLAFLEYYLTKAYLRYSRGQRYGFVSPDKLLNHLEKEEKDSANSPFKTLFSLSVEKMNDAFVHEALLQLQTQQLSSFLQRIQPENKLYRQLQDALLSDTFPKEKRRILAINMERARWRHAEIPEKNCVIVNLPSQHLTAFNKNKAPLIMKICCGSLSHKTPLLQSRISYLELNPYWIIPQKIVKHELLVHAGDTNYFNRHHYQIVERASGDIVSPLDVTSRMLLSGAYLVRQEKGDVNSLGRLIFRFPNDHAIYLHDTNQRYIFSRAFRCVSHGCIRVEKPYELALYLMEKEDEKEIDRIRVALDMQPLTAFGRQLFADEQAPRLNRHNYQPTIPLSIIYYTCFPDPESGQLQFYPDIYHYDDLLWKSLSAS